MGAVSSVLQDMTFGFFELDDRGIVRYSRARTDAVGGDSSLIGQNFFELAGFENRKDLRRHFRRFIESEQAADIFTFDCFFNQAIVRAKVTMTRAFQTEAFPPEKIVMLDIREIDC
ncbi:MAG TPA: hypothetical protein VEV84_01820 [Pyrinomonadaceae bacterium]|nr:hypothetical protein [Pyrinomonadaceae bacterium]